MPAQTFEDLQSAYAQQFPGFDQVVIDIMAHIAMGKTPEEAAEFTGSVDALLQEEIERIDATHARWDQDGAVCIPPAVLEAIDESVEAEGE